MRSVRCIQLRYTLRSGLFLFLALFLQAAYPRQSASLLAKKITISFSGENMLSALHSIEKTAGIEFAFNADKLEDLKTPALSFSSKTLENVLSTLFRNTPLQFKEMNGYIIITRGPAKEPVPIKKNRPGQFSGRIIDQENSLPIAGATIRISDLGTTSDDHGAFTVSLAKGKYEAEVSSMGYGTKKITEISIKEGEMVELTIPLKREKNQLSSVTVSAQRIRETGTNISMINEIRTSNAVLSGVSKEQIVRSQDRDAAQVVRRIPGVSIIDDRFIVVRGLPQRYNSVLLNNITAPSFEADSRAFSFETIPSGMIDRVMVYKTALPELPGDFAGGVVKVYTTDLPLRNEFNISYQTSVRPNTTFKEFREQKQGSKAWIGYDDGTYAGAFNRKEREIDVKKLKAEKEPYWEYNSRTAPIDQRLNLNLSRIWNVSNATRIGVVAGGGYSNTFQSRFISLNTGQSNSVAKKFFPMYTFLDNEQNHDVRVNALANISLDLNHGKHLIVFKNLYTHLGSFQFRERKGISHSDAEDGIGFYENMQLRQVIQGNSFKTIYNSQLTGKHKLFSTTVVDWTLGYTKSIFEDPDQRSRVFTTPRRGNQADSLGNIIWEEPLNVEGVGNSMRRRRNFIYMPEETRTLALNLSQQVNVGASFKLVIKAGIYVEKREREFTFRGATLNAPKAGDPADKTYYLYYPVPEGSFNAFNEVKAGYLALSLPISKRLNFYGGVRLEDYTVNVKGSSWATTGPYVGIIQVDQHRVTYLPSANISYQLSSHGQLRAAYSKTLNRAEFREISASQYFDMALFQTIYGNPDMQPQTNIHNVDLRYELYPASGEVFNVGLFYKYLENPPELYTFDRGGNGNSYYWGNARNSKLYGAEMELLLSMGRFFKGDSWCHRQLQKFSLMANATYTWGSLNMNDSLHLFGQVINLSHYIIMNRLLYGQSRYMINAGLNFTDDKLGIRTTLAYNIIGKRIVNVGSQNNPNVWEMPRHSLDITFFKRIYKTLELRGGIQNMLNSRFRMMQDANYDGKIDKDPDVADYSYKERDNRFKSWYDGTYYSLGLFLQLR